MDNSSKLLELAKEKFGNLTESEEKLFESAADGILADYSDQDEKNNDPRTAKSWSEERIIKADRIAWLCADAKASQLVTYRGVVVKGARFDSMLFMPYVNVEFPLEFEKCAFSEAIELHCADLEELCLKGTHTRNINADGIRVRGSVFLRCGFRCEGEVQLIRAEIQGDLDCHKGYFINEQARAINANGATILGNCLMNSGFEARGKVSLCNANIRGFLSCSDGHFINQDGITIDLRLIKCEVDAYFSGDFQAEGEVSLAGATIGGNLYSLGAQFRNIRGVAFDGEGLNVAGSVFLNSCFRGETCLLGTTVGRCLECDKGQFVNPGEYAINADSLKVGGSVFLRYDFKAEGEVVLIGAQIGGSIDCERGKFTNPNGIAIHADEIEVGCSVFLRYGFMAEGIVSFAGGRIKINFDCEYGQFTNKITPAILAEGLNVGGSVLLCSRYSDDQTNDNMPKQFRAEGGVSFKRAVIGGDFACQGSQFINHIGYAFLCSGVKVNGNVYLCNSSKSVKQKEKTDTPYQVFRAEGQVDFSNARIGGALYCNGGKFINKGKDGSANKGENVALSLDCIEVDDSIILSNNFHAEGQVSLLGAKIGGQLNCIAGQFINPDGIAFVAECAIIGGNTFLCGSDYKGGKSREKVLENNIRIEGKVLFHGAEVRGCFLWCKVASPEKTSLDLRCAKIGSLWDEKKSWPEKGKLFLYGLIYNEIDDRAPRDARSRIEWIRRQGDFFAQPYEQLARVLREEGHEADAKKVLIAKNKDRARLGTMGFLEKFWYRLLGISIGYGYQPSKALLWIMGFIIIGAAFFSFGDSNGLITPTKDMEYVSKLEANEVSKEYRVSKDYPEFQAVIYSIDVLVPIIDLHQSKYWLPNLNNGKVIFECKGYEILTGGILLGYMWFHIIMGWILTTLLLGGLTGLIRR